jgi:hypothetical protein
MYIYIYNIFEASRTRPRAVTCMVDRHAVVTESKNDTHTHIHTDKRYIHTCIQVTTHTCIPEASRSRGGHLHGRQTCRCDRVRKPAPKRGRRAHWSRRSRSRPVYVCMYVCMYGCVEYVGQDEAGRNLCMCVYVCMYVCMSVYTTMSL